MLSLHDIPAPKPSVDLDFSISGIRAERAKPAISPTVAFVLAAILSPVLFALLVTQFPLVLLAVICLTPLIAMRKRSRRLPQVGNGDEAEMTR